MLVGPVFVREALTLPRRTRFFAARAAYVFMLLLLTCTAWLVLTGTQVVRNVGDLARFGAILFQILAPLQLAMALLFSALLAASAVAQEKDRRTLTLLLLTRMSNAELVLGKLLASLLPVAVMLAAALPLFMAVLLFGGISMAQVACVFAITAASILVAGSLGSTVALWREKTFQALAMTALALAFWLTFWQMVAAGLIGERWSGLSATAWATLFSPWQAVLQATRGGPRSPWSGVILGFLAVATGLAAGLNLVAMAMLRIWNPARAARRIERLDDQTAVAGALEAAGVVKDPAQTHADGPAVPAARKRPARTRPVWDNPILWREVRTWAYGRKILVIRGAYWILVALTAAVLWVTVAAADTAAVAPGRPLIPAEAKPIAPLLLLSLVLVNALAVTSLTTERDGRAIDLLLVSDLTPREFVFGKLGGVLYNAKEMILLPVLLGCYLCYAEKISGENLVYLLGGYLVMVGFVAVLGLHAGMRYASSRAAIGVSLGTLLFLFLGVATCMRMMIAFSGSFQIQLQPFLAFMLGGGVGLYVALGAGNPSPAIALAAFLAPFTTFYVITSWLIGYPLASFLVTVATYGFATAAMLVPALYEFDVATGRTTAR